MEWIWIIFILFSILSSLAEKKRKSMRPEAQNPVPQQNRRPPLPDWAKEFAEVFGLEEEEVEARAEPKTTTGAGDGFGKSEYPDSLDSNSPWTGTASLEGKSTASLGKEGRRQGESRVWLDEVGDGDGAFTKERVGLAGKGEDLARIGGTKTLTFLEDAGEDSHDKLRRAMILAHVLPRPDFPRIPWQRKL